MTAPVRVALVGMGKMGHALADLAPQRGFTVVARLDAEAMRDFTADRLADAEVAIEFTMPDAAPANVRRLVAAGVPVVVGTTGWHGSYDAVAAEVRTQGGAMLHAPNFSIGVTAFAQVLARAAELLTREAGFDAHLVETHHTQKKDAPSGTARFLADAMRERAGAAPPITSVRVGSVPGTHEITFDAPFETVRLVHVARDRRVFAEGALAAARWLRGRTGVFTMRDLLASPNAPEETRR